jgi:hypothetical protein
MIHQGLGIAVIAARRDMLAPNPRVERVIAPFNFAVFTHGNSHFEGWLAGERGNKELTFIERLLIWFSC